MDETNRRPPTARMTVVPQSSKEKENSRSPTIRPSLPASSTSSSTRKSPVSTLPFQFVESTNRSIGNNDAHRSKVISEVCNTTTSSTTPTKSTTHASAKMDDKSCTTSTESVSRTSSLSSSSSTATLTTHPPATTSTSPLSVVDFDAASSFVTAATSLTADSRPATALSTTTMINSIIQQYPPELIDASKLHTFQQVLTSLSTNNDGSSSAICTPATSATETIGDVVHIVMTDMVRLQQMLATAEERITTLQNNKGLLKSSEQFRVVEPTTCDNVMHASDGTAVTSIHAGINDVSASQERIAKLEKELRMSESIIDQLKNQKHHIIANTKKKKLIFDEMERTVLTTDQELQTVLSERNGLRQQLQEMTESRDSYKQKLRNQQEIVKDSKHAMMEYKHKLQKTEHMRSLENELLDNFRKLAIHTGFYRWGKPIRLLEVAIAAAAVDFEESSGGTVSTSTGEEDFD